MRKDISIFTVDVEDWFHILDVASTPPVSRWDELPGRVEQNTRRILSLCEEHGVRATFFFLGWVARRYPHLVKEAAAKGHEIASHGFSHRLVYEMSPDEALDDMRESKRLLEDLAGMQVHGFRAPGFSVLDEAPWFFETLLEAGFTYDSSVFPGPRGHGGMRSNRFGPYIVSVGEKSLVEFPVSLIKFAGRNICFSGGGYLRLFPYRFVRYLAEKTLASGRPVMFYVHPREIDPKHPRLPMSLFREFKSYVNLASTERKLRKLFNDFTLVSCKGFIGQYMESFPVVKLGATAGGNDPGVSSAR